jgi:hypothetical protein
MAALTVQNISKTGLAAAFTAAAAGGDSFANDSTERTVLHCKNTNAATRDVTIVAQRTTANVPGGGAVTIPNITVTIPATTGDVEIGPFPDAYNDSNGNVQVTYSAVANLTVAAKKLVRVSV